MKRSTDNAICGIIMGTCILVTLIAAIPEGHFWDLVYIGGGLLVGGLLLTSGVNVIPTSYKYTRKD